MKIILLITILPLFTLGRLFISDNVPALDSFEVQRYTGLWYEAARSKNLWFEKGDHCTATYTDIGNNVIRVENRGIDNGKVNSIRGKAKPNGSGIPGRLSLTFDPWYTRIIAGRYYIVDTDYDNYSLVVAPPRFFWDRMIGYILTRQRTIPEEMLEDLVQKLNDLVGIKKEDLYFTDQR